MEAVYGLYFHVLELPHIKIKKPGWIKAPSAMVVFALVLLSYFLVTGGKTLLLSCRGLSWGGLGYKLYTLTMNVSIYNRGLLYRDYYIDLYLLIRIVFSG